MRLPHVTDLADVDAAAVGIPFDTGTSFRPGPRFGPEAIRSASSLLRPYHPVHDVDLVETLSVVDYGDVPVAPGDTPGSLEGSRQGWPRSPTQASSRSGSAATTRSRSPSSAPTPAGAGRSRSS